MAPGSRRQPAGGRGSDIRRALLRSALLGLLMFLVVGAGTVLWAWQLAREEALRDAANLGATSANGVIRSLATPALLAGDPDALDAMDRVIQPQLDDGSVLLAKIWRQDGTVVYSNRAVLVGQRFPLEPDVRDAFGAAATAEVSVMEKAENVLDDRTGPQVEVYAPFTAPEGERLLYEVYLPLKRLPQAQREIAYANLPLTLTVLGCLQLLQVPLWVSLVRSVRANELARRQLLERSAAASETERRRLARFLHDDVIQNLAGVAYALDMMPRALPEQTSAAVRGALANAGQAVTANLGALRALIADLYPGRLDEVGLEAALEGLLKPLRSKGIRAELVIDPGLDPPAAVATVVYAVAREAIRNADQHAAPAAISVRVEGDDTMLRLTVTDDGAGFDTDREPVTRPRVTAVGSAEPGGAVATDAPERTGHYGLRLIRDTVTDAGGTLTLSSTPGAGTRVQVELPYHLADQT